MQSCPANTATGAEASTTAPLRSPARSPTSTNTSPGVRLSRRTVSVSPVTPALRGRVTVTDVVSPCTAVTAMKPPSVTPGAGDQLGAVSTR